MRARRDPVGLVIELVLAVVALAGVGTAAAARRIGRRRRDEVVRWLGEDREGWA